MKRLLQAPHRMCFFAAAIQVLLASAWWGASLFVHAQVTAFPFPQGVESARVHAFILVYGFFPLIAFGYLHAALPAWLARPAPATRQYAAPSIVAGVAAWLLLPAFYLGNFAVTLVILAMLGAWGWMLGYFVMLIDASRGRSRGHAIVVALAITAGIAGLVAARLWLLNQSAPAARATLLIGLWGFLVPLCLAVGHHMMRSMGARLASPVAAWLSTWSLAILVAGSVLHGFLAGFAPQWTWIVDVPLGAAVVVLAAAWGFSQASGSRIVAMLHAALAWLGTAWLLYGTQSGFALADSATLGAAPTHALAIGFLATATLAMACRVTHPIQGHRVDAAMWGVFVAIQVTALLRVGADLWSGAYTQLVAFAAALWLASIAIWCWRHVPALGSRPTR